MKVSEFDYFLPKELIAQKPSDKREDSRMMVIDREKGSISHFRFRDILKLIDPSYLIVLNNSKVFPARLFGKKEGGGANIEVLLIRDMGGGVWKVFLRPAKRLKVGGKIAFEEGVLCEVLEILSDGSRLVKFNIVENDFYDFLFKWGKIPLPPYINGDRVGSEEFHRKRYQTVFAKKLGSVAAPTAGLHFSEEILRGIKKIGIEICEITLHVGPGTFRPVVVEDVEKHTMDEEFYSVGEGVALKIREHKRNGGKILAVGTTTTRTLETLAIKYGKNIKGEMGFTNLFIYPPFEFKIVDKLLTNFHLPRSTLLMLVSAFAGKDLIMKAYEEAVKQRYRFYSYGDCMLIL